MKQKERLRETERESIETQRHRETDRQRETERHRETQRVRQRDYLPGRIGNNFNSGKVVGVRIPRLGVRCVPGITALTTKAYRMSKKS